MYSIKTLIDNSCSFCIVASYSINLCVGCNAIGNISIKINDRSGLFERTGTPTRDMKIILKILIPLCLYACSNDHSPEAVLSQTSAQWKRDLNYLSEQLPKLHNNSFHSISKDAFQKQ